MKITTLTLLLVLSITLGCKAQSAKGYTNITKLYEDFPKVLKSNNWQTIDDYFNKVLINKSTMGYMEEHELSYGDFRYNALRIEPLIVHFFKIHYLNTVLKFRLYLKERNLLQNLTFVSADNPPEIVNKKLGIQLNETLITLKSGTRTILCKLGEIYKVEGEWRVFTTPKFW